MRIHRSNFVKIGSISAGLILTLGLVGLAGGGGFANAAGAAKAGDYMIGVDGDLTGSTAPIGNGIANGVRAATDAVNAAGGIHGHHVTMIVRDDAGTPTTGLTNVRGMVLNSHVSAVLGMNDSNVVAATAPIFAQLQVPLVSCCIGSATTDTEPPYIYLSTANQTLMGNAELTEIQEMVSAGELPQHPRVAFAAFTSPAGAEWLASAVSDATKLGLDPVGSVSLPFNAASFGAQASSIAGMHPDVIASFLNNVLEAPLFQALAAAGVSPSVPTLGVWFASGVKTMETYSWNDFIGETSYHLVPGKNGAGTKAIKAFDKATARVPISPAVPDVAEGYATALLVFHALQMCGYPCDGAKLNTYLQKDHSNLGGFALGSLGWTKHEHTAATYIQFYKVSSSGKINNVGLPVNSASGETSGY